MNRFMIGVATLTITLFPAAVHAAPAFSEDFEIDPTGNWTVNSGPVLQPGDNSANFFFDYSTVGIPLAPHSKSDGTHGLNLQANQNVASDGISVPQLTGISVSPAGQDFSSFGGFRLRFDLWQNFPGPFPNGSSGTTQLSTFGVATSGTYANYPGSVDSVMFAASTDGGSSADFRAYSSERVVSYQLPPYLNPDTDIDVNGNPIDSHATYYAGSRNHTAALYQSNFGGAMAPADQLALYPQQTGTTALGSTGMEWHDVEIVKLNNLISWSIDGVLIASVDVTNVVTPIGGGNILFGHSDINAGPSADPNRFELLFTLIDNVEVTVIPEPATLWASLTGLAAIACGSRRR